jgi:CHAT domain-containing protein
MDSHLEAFTKLLNRPDLGSPETYANHAGYLYDFLLRDVLTDTKVEHLVIIPDGRLGYLPFQVLIDNRQLEGLEDYRKLPYVINNYEVRYEYSSTLLLAEHTPKKQRGGFLGFAPKYGDEGTGISVRAAVEEDILADEDGGEVMRLASLQYTQTEVEEISHLFTGQSHIGNLATEAAFKSEASKHSILHLAMHAHTSDENPMYSRLIFQQGASEGGEDGMLYAYELYNMNLQAELAVLSACETGTGKLQNGEGIMSLSRAFKYAGCPNIVMSLWQADDASTKDIMVQFYENLKKGMGKAEALRKAKTKYLSETGFNKSHPFYWATFVLAGDDESVQME